MTKLTYPDRIYLLSDTCGGERVWDPYSSPDIDAYIATDIRSRLQNIHRSFDTFGVKSISDHVLRTVSSLHEEEGDVGETGVFINSAPRTEEGSNGDPFYVAQTNNNICVVATPISALSALKNRISSLHHLPNEDNGLYSGREQFRSSLTVTLLASDHGHDLVEDVVSDIPDYPKGCHVSYADRFGNLVLFEEGYEVVKRAVLDNLGKAIYLNVAGVQQEVVVGESLGEAKPGSLVVYQNDGNIEVVSKWDANWSADECLSRSAYEQFGRPDIGSKVQSWVGNKRFIGLVWKK